MSKSTWTGAVNSDWADADNWSPAGVPGADSDVTIATGDAVASASIGTVNSITDSSDLSFESAGTNTVTTTLDNTGSLHVDDSAGEGGTILNIGGTLTNSHHLTIGNATLSAPDEVTAASLDNTGSIVLTGSSADQALLDVTAGSAGFGTAGVLSGYVRLVGDSAIEFASGEITSLAANAQLHINGDDAFIEDSTALGSNSALTGLASIGAGAIFGLHNKAAVSTAGSLANDGTIRLDFVRGDGGSSLTLAGALTNSHDLIIGNTKLSASDKVAAASLDNTGKIQLTGSGANQALLDVTGSAGFGAAGVLSGNVELSGDSAIEFASGQITSLAGSLTLFGNDAFLEDSTALGSNSALTGLASIGAGATLNLESGAAVSTTGALVNDGTVDLNANYYDGGSSLTLAGDRTRVEQRADGARFDRRRSDVRAQWPRLAVDDRRGRQQRPCQYWGGRDRDRDRHPLDRWRADQHRHAEYFRVQLRYGEILRHQRDGQSDRQRDTFGRPQRVGSADQQRLDFDRLRHRGGRRSGRRHGVFRPRRLCG